MGSKWSTADAVRNIKISFLSCRLMVVRKSCSFDRELVSTISLSFPLPFVLLSVFVHSSSFAAGAGNTCVVLCRRFFGNVNITSEAKNILVETNIKPERMKIIMKVSMSFIHFEVAQTRRFLQEKSFWHVQRSKVGYCKKPVRCGESRNCSLFYYDFLMIIYFFCVPF